MTKATDYAIVILAHLASEAIETVHTARDVSVRTGLPLPMVTKTMKLLAHKDFLDSQRGVKGGYRLARRPEDFSVAEVISALEGPIRLTECTGGPTCRCPMESSCRVRAPWQTINEAVLKTLRAIPLSMMAHNFKPLPTIPAPREPGESS